MMKCKVYDGGYKPTKAHPYDAGFDMYLPDLPDLDCKLTIQTNQSVCVDTRVAVQIPEGYVGILFNKSGLNIKCNITCSNGVIDSHYTGTITVKIENHSDKPFTFHSGEKIGQMVVLMHHPDMKMELVDDLGETDRGTNGFGSTGK